MCQRVARYRPEREAVLAATHQVGCIVLTQPFLFGENEWISVPPDWKANIVRGKSYSLDSAPGESLWREVQLGLARQALPTGESRAGEAQATRYGAPVLVAPRLGQGGFRTVVTDAYQRRCAITGERVLPVLEAAHIRPYSMGGPHQVDNGILLRSDLHRLFDQGFLTVDSGYHLNVSQAIRDQYANGKEYYALRGRSLVLPSKKSDWPGREFIIWHNREVFLG